ncbi:MAG: hypothetical protein ACLRX6_03160 [Limosilactobacillus pontis]|uniref:hypothetical protein n=1 Tax=Limosilactobacillus pontis TaxID=35787 RepID=UPI0039A036FC
MPDGIIGNNFDKFLEKADRGFTLGERKKVNKVGDKVYEKAMQSFLDAHRRHVVYKDGTQHLADTLTHEIKEDGHYEIGFSKKGKKAYIARFLNDGWRPRNQFGGPYGIADPAEWNDFIARIGQQNDAKMGKAMARRAKKIMDEKAGGH